MIISGASPAPRGNSFCFLDGESIAGKFVLLRSSRRDRLANLNGLTTLQCLNFLCDVRKRHGKMVYCGFVFSYDVNMILGDLPKRKIAFLWETGSVYWQGFVIRYRHRKEFGVRRIADDARLTVWDTFGFFQSSFVKALESWGICDPSEIAAMKARRSTFTIADFPQIDRYCAQECAHGQKLMEGLQDALDFAGVRLMRYDGAGAVAAGMLKIRGVKAHNAALPKYVERAARGAYYGGRIECVKFGRAAGTVYAYDLISAYPAALRSAPCLACGEWFRGFKRDATHVLARVSWNLDGNVMPFPWRAPDGSIYFARRGRGWYWFSEISAAWRALDAGIVSGTIKVHEAISFVPGCEHAPYGWIDETFRTRAQWKREGNAAEKVLKLGLNSLYGKCAQRVGHGHKRPTYHQIVWAGMTTAATRAALYKASFPAIANNTLLFYATDAIACLDPLDLPPGDGQRPGGWECERFDGATIVQSGVYWLGGEIAKTRGFDVGDLTESDVISAWRAGRSDFESSSTRFVGMGLALLNSWDQWRTFQTRPRVLKLHPLGTKRDLPNGARPRAAWRRLYDTVPADTSRFRRIDSTSLAFAWADGEFDPDNDRNLYRANAEGEDAKL